MGGVGGAESTGWLVPRPVHQNGADSGLRGPKCRRCQSKWSVSGKNLSLSWTELGLSWTGLGLSWTELGFSRKWLGFGLNSQGVRELSIKIAPLGVVAPRSKMVDLSIKIARIRAGWLRGATSDLSIKLGKC